MTFKEMQEEVSARGFNYLDASGLARIKRWINQAMHELTEAEDWNFRETSASGDAPLTVTDLGPIGSVVETATNTALVPADRRTLSDAYRDLTTTGTPLYYYTDGSETVRTYPVGGTISVRYWKVATDLSADGDEPIVPGRYHDAIVNGACRRAYLDDDDAEGAKACEAERQTVLGTMRNNLLGWQYDQPDSVLVVSQSDDG